jgi:hypothetical protein
MTLTLSRPEAAAVPATEWLDSGISPAPGGRPVQQGQRPPRPTEAEREAALEVLRERAQRGTFAGELPPSAEEMRADQARREARRKDAALIRRIGRPAAPAPAHRPGLLGRVFGR